MSEIALHPILQVKMDYDYSSSKISLWKTQKNGECGIDKVEDWNYNYSQLHYKLASFL